EAAVARVQILGVPAFGPFLLAFGREELEGRVGGEGEDEGGAALGVPGAERLIHGRACPPADGCPRRAGRGRTPSAAARCARASRARTAPCPRTRAARCPRAGRRGSCRGTRRRPSAP